MECLNVMVHDVVGTDFVVCSLYIILHEYQHPFIIPFYNTLTLDIDKFQQYHYVLAYHAPGAIHI